ncbi:MAG: cold shock domain-containing protein [Anaerolineae bacterium]|nr:cold shock domain-containing protein [Anaerolineae bacterium]
MHEYRDRTSECQRCGIPFIWTAGELPRAASNRRDGCARPARNCCPRSGRERGLVKWYNLRRGYGFISRSTGEDLFFHRDALPADAGAIEPNLLLEYGIEHTPGTAGEPDQGVDVKVS